MKNPPAEYLPPARASEPLTNHICLKAQAAIGKLHFTVSYTAGGQRKVLTGIWSNKQSQEQGLGALSGELADSPLSFQIPEVLADYGLAVRELRFDYAFEAEEFSFRMVTGQYGTLSVSTKKNKEQREFTFKLELDMRLELSHMPLLGECIGSDIAAELDWLGLKTGGSQKTALGACFAILIGDTRIPVALPDTWEAYALTEGEDEEQVKWLDVRKKLGPVQLSRLGFALGDAGITVYVDAGLKLSILLLEVLGLYVTVPMKKGQSVGFGIQGMTVSLQKEPLSVSGGLYITREEDVELYTGELSVKVKNFQLTALGSYGRLPGAEASFFAFLMLNYPLGGPPIFYVTGIAGGFGYNRSIILPSRPEEVIDFPFIAAVMGKGELKADMTPAQVLKSMNTTIVPEKGQFFASAGIRFTSFGLLDSFLLLNVLWGNALKIALMGVSTLAMPPKEAKPFVYAELSLLAVIAPSEGVVSIAGALSSQSFLLDRNCKLQGGFAFVTWFGDNEHSGDFVLTMGGYKEGFCVAHYPKVDRIGICWNLDQNLVLQASFYFALTPSCVMLGGNASITYECGRLRAWFRAGLEFYMKWKPFAYEFYVGVSLGASFRWDFFPFYRTFSLELGASLNCYGPPFGGSVHISWFIISFTIAFGAGKCTEAALDWDEFSSAFLAEGSSNSGKKLLSVQAVGAGGHKSGEALSWYSPGCLMLEVKSLLPATAITVRREDGADILAPANDEALGVVPMKLSSFESTLEVEVRDASGKICNMNAVWVYGNVPKALWNTETPNPYDSEGLKKDCLMGVRLTSPEAKVLGQLPEKGYYSMKVLCENERLGPLHFAWTAPTPVEPGSYPGKVLEQMEKTIVVNHKRNSILEQLSDNYGTKEKVAMENWGSGLEEILIGEPLLTATGSR